MGLPIDRAGRSDSRLIPAGTLSFSEIPGESDEAAGMAISTEPFVGVSQQTVGFDVFDGLGHSYRLQDGEGNDIQVTFSDPSAVGAPGQALLFHGWRARFAVPTLNAVRVRVSRKG